MRKFNENEIYFINSFYKWLYEELGLGLDRIYEINSETLYILYKFYYTEIYELREQYNVNCQTVAKIAKGDRSVICEYKERNRGLHAETDCEGKI